MRSLPGSDLDWGWTGTAHNAVVSHDGVVTTNLNCVDDICVVDGSDLVGQAVGSPLPISAGGVSVCVVSAFREAVTGTYDTSTGCSEASIKLLSRVFLAEDAERPCPPCIGDPTPNDRIRAGTCFGGTSPGAACDVGGISDPFQNASGQASDFGMTSNDCLPTGDGVWDLPIDVSPLTTATVVVTASVDCLSDAFPAGSCYCPGQVRPNACEPDGVCPASGVCEAGPIDSVCEGQTFRRCGSGTGTRDCDAVFPGAGSCVDQPRPCFGATVARTGICGTEQSSLVAFFCIPATNEAAIDATVGLPGPGAITLPISLIRTPR
ncbi:MAG: hypothetical protein ABIR79_06345 [Candidatus Binatia bacterium]